MTAYTVTTPKLSVDCVVVTPERRVLLIRRRWPPAKGALALPGGFVEVGETVERACVRELAEETGVDVVVFECNFAGPGVEVVDVTDALVELFSPTVETRTTIDALLRNDPVPLEDLHPEH